MTQRVSKTAKKQKRNTELLEFVQDYIPVKSIHHGIIEMRDGRYIRILEIEPINFMLRSDEEQYNIISSFASWLKISPQHLQFKSFTRRADSDKHVQLLRQELEQEQNEECRRQGEGYIRFVRDVGNREALTRRFFLIYQYEEQRRGDSEDFGQVYSTIQTVEQNARAYFLQCGNAIVQPKDPDEATAEILYMFFNRRSCVDNDCHLYVFGIDVTKQFADGKGDYSQVEFLIHNDTDNYYLVGQLNKDEGVYYVTGHVAEETDATHFIPVDTGKMVIKGVENDSYTMTEVKTSNGYTLLKNSIKIVISKVESEQYCDIYSTDALGLLQNDPRYANVEPGKYHNMPQKHLAHKLLSASATVDDNAVTMGKDGTSDHAFVPFTIVNTRGFDLPQTGSYGNWMFPVFGLTGLAIAIAGIVLLTKKKAAKN